LPSRPTKGGSVPDAVRRAVERTFQATLGSAPLTRERAQEVADDVLRRAEEGAGRARRGVQQAGARQREAAAGVGDRLRDAITEIRNIGGDELSELRAELQRLSRRVDVLERDAGKGTRAAKPRRKTAANPRAGASKPAARSRARTTKRSPKPRKG
jgi:polyhydroxyalkanoate synthesis regulator phasin